MLRNSIGTLVTESVQLGDQRFAFDPLTLRDTACELANAERCQHSLGRRGGRRDEQLRLFALRLERIQRCKPLRHHSESRRRSVEGQAVPGWKGQDFHFGGK